MMLMVVLVVVVVVVLFVWGMSTSQHVCTLELDPIDTETHMVMSMQMDIAIRHWCARIAGHGRYGRVALLTCAFHFYALHLLPLTFDSGAYMADRRGHHGREA